MEGETSSEAEYREIHSLARAIASELESATEDDAKHPLMIQLHHDMFSSDWTQKDWSPEEAARARRAYAAKDEEAIQELIRTSFLTSFRRKKERMDEILAIKRDADEVDSLKEEVESLRSQVQEQEDAYDLKVKEKEARLRRQLARLKKACNT
jgi:hypothetical protein